MAEDRSQEAVIDQYLNEVAGNLSHVEPRQRETVLRELREHVWEAVRERAQDRPPTLQDVYAALADTDPPEEFANQARQTAPHGEESRNLTVLALMCALMQIGGLASAVTGVAVLPGIAGFAAIVAYLLARARAATPGWQLKLFAVAAACGLGLILFEVVRSL